MYLLELLYKIYELVIERLKIVLASINKLFIGIGDFFNHILGLISNLYYTLILLVDSLKYVFNIISLNFFTVGLLPNTIIVCTVAFVIMITALTIPISMGWLFPPFAPFSMMWLFAFLDYFSNFLITLAIVIILHYI